MGGKTRTDAAGKVTQGWDHDPPAKKKLTPLGILVLATGALTLIFGSQETSDFWVDALQLWWGSVRAQYTHVRRLVIYLEEAVVNWDSGHLTRREVTQTLDAFLAAVPSLAGMDVVGDWSPVEMRGAMRHFLHWTEHPRLRIDPSEFRDAIAMQSCTVDDHDRLNLALSRF